MEIVVKVKEIRGHCPTFKLGDSFVLKAGYQLVSDIPVCMHALAALMPFYNALCVSDPAQWGLDGKEDKSKAYIQCPDPFDCTNGGTVIFEISKQ
ncbi:MAG: hypothetical protein A2Z38_10170 [Planctomycetes bacterium RBG_19FT_COMBO_48_8]|nr:MAG: hypothetical protein A2Z38_10170 [Planctomycetes bacterium RBG_19FT_COMBO_48_8]